MNHLLKKYFLVVIVFSMILAPVFSARANHHKTPYPSSGLLWLSAKKNYVGLVYVTSNNCNVSETNAYADIKNSSIYAFEMNKWYYTGIRMTPYRCDGAYTNYADLKINYTTSYTASWGINNDVIAPPEFCAFWNVSYPCGVRPTVTINLGQWNRINDINRRRLIMHETGHSLGLNHHCTDDAIMNDGTSSCNGGRWLVISGYTVWDRIGLQAVY